MRVCTHTPTQTMQLFELLNLFGFSMPMSPRMEKVKEGEKESIANACAICTDNGELLYCDSGTSTFHLECLAVTVPKGSWSCYN